MGWVAKIMADYGEGVVFLASILGSIGLPFPAFPILMLSGALSLTGTVSFPGSVIGAVLGSVAANLTWYFLGKWRGRAVLFTLCRMSLNPDACMERAVFQFHLRPATMILFSKFLPGANTIVPSLAGMLSLPLHRFLSLCVLGVLIWATAGVGLGWVFGVEILRYGAMFNNALGWLLLAGIVVYIVWRIAYRYYLIHRFSVPRLAPEDLFRKIASGEDVVVLDLRIDTAYASSGAMVAGARRFRPATFLQHAHELPRDRDLVFYCT